MTDSDTPKVQPDKIGLASFTWKGKTIWLEGKIKSMIRIHALYRMSLNEWLNYSYESGEVGQAEILLHLQVHSNHSLEDLIEMFFLEIADEEKVEFELAFLKTLCEITGKDYKAILNSLPAELTSKKKAD